MTKKKIIISAVILILLVVAGCIAWRCRFYFIGTGSAPVRAKENEDFGIADFHTSVDRDEDGRAAQTRKLQGARAHIETNAVYESKEYHDSTTYKHKGARQYTDGQRGIITVMGLSEIDPYH